MLTIGDDIILVKKKLPLLLAFLGGFASLELEILGTRLISPVYGSTIYVWTSLITITLLGLSLGYYFGGNLIDKNKINLKKLGLVILFTGIYLIFLPSFSRYVIKSLFFYFDVVSGPLIISFLILFLPMVFLGTIFPSCVKLDTEKMEEVGRKAGKISVLSTIGGLTGSLLTGYYLILNVGITTTCLATGTIFILISFLIYFRKRFLIFMLLPLLLYFFAPSLPQGLAYYGSGYYSEIRVLDSGGARILFLDNMINTAKVDYPTYVNFFEAPFYFRNISSVLMIGLGGGEGVKFLDNNFNVSIDVVEIDPKVIEVAQGYFEFDPEKFDIAIDDGRHYLLTTDKKYDLIISDIAMVDWVPYLYTLEFYEIVKDHLNQDGIFLNHVLAIKSGANSNLAQIVYSDLNSIFNDILVLKDPHGRDDSFNTIFYLASDKKMVVDMGLDGGRPVEEALINSFRYGEFGLKNTDDFAPGERFSLNDIRNIHLKAMAEQLKQTI